MLLRRVIIINNNISRRKGIKDYKGNVTAWAATSYSWKAGAPGRMAGHARSSEKLRGSLDHCNDPAILDRWLNEMILRSGRNVLETEEYLKARSLPCI